MPMKDTTMEYDEDFDEDDLPRAKCRNCGAETVYWQEVWDKNGVGHWRLFDDSTNHPHVCDVTNLFPE